MKLHFDDLKYGDHLVVKKGELTIKCGVPTVVTGESGSGKTSLFNYLCKHTNCCISSASQEAIFLNGLTVKEHIEMLRETEGDNPDTERYIEMLGLKELLNQYPSELSGGECKRLSFLLCLMKNADLYILDEPTASLDEKFTDGMIQIILGEKNKQFLLFTHDQKILDIRSNKYQIKNQKLVNDLLDNDDNDEDKPIKLIKQNCHDHSIVYGKYLYRSTIRKHIFLKAIELLVTISIAVVGIMNARSKAMVDSIHRIMNQMNSNEIIVFKPNCITKDSAGNELYNYEMQEPFKNEELDEIRKIQHLDAIEWRYDLTESAWNVDITKEELPVNELNNPDMNVSLYVSVYDHGEKKTEIKLNEGTLISTYLPEKKQKSDIKLDFSGNGLYISKRIADEIEAKIGEIKEGLELEMEISVPVYNTYGRVQAAIDNETPQYVFSTTIDYDIVKQPISGVLTWSDFGLPANGRENVIYINRDVMEEMIEKHRRNEDRVIYAFDERWTDYTINDCPPEKLGTENRRMEDYIWRPTAYSLFVEGVEFIPEIMDELHKMGFACISEYMQKNGNMLGIRSIHKTYVTGSWFLFFMILCACISIRVLQRKRNEVINRFFRQIGVKNIREIRRNSYILKTIQDLGIIILISVCYYVYMSKIYHYAIIPSFSSICMTALLVLGCDVVIQILADRYENAEIR